jgi:cyanophycinase
MIFAGTSSAALAQKNNRKGHLVIIGGGPRPESVMKRIIELAGGAKSRIVIIPMASSEPLEVAKTQKVQFEKFGAPNVDFVNSTAATADADSNLAKIRTATGIFFSGGDQSRLKAALWGTKLLSEIYALYEQRGGLVAGTSAGAAIQSKIMITGDEAVNQDSTQPFSVIQRGNIVTDIGFGFIDNAIIDQHFIKRKRQNRLLTLVLENPRIVGIGIDESTGIIVKPNNTFEVAGEATVMVFDASTCKHIATDGNKNLSAESVIVHILPSGVSFDFATKRVLR